MLIPDHSIEAGKDFTRVRATVRWTFPLRMAEVAWGDGTYTKRHTIPLEETAPFGKADYDWRLEVYAPRGMGRSGERGVHHARPERVTSQVLYIGERR